jgi:hypothetical protein
MATSWAFPPAGHVSHDHAALRARVSQVLGLGGLLVIFAGSVFVSARRLTRHKRAFYVPLLGAAAMIVCFVAYGLTVNAGLGI